MSTNNCEISVVGWGLIMAQRLAKFENYWKRELANRDDTIAEKDIVISNLMVEIEQLRKGN